MKRVLVVGAGASGLLAAGFAARGGADVVLLERNDRPARKLMITGKGRCNCTNASDVQGLISHVPGNGRFLYSAFSAFTPEDLRSLLERYGVPTKVERGARVFPVSDKAADVAHALVRFAEEAGAQVVTARVRSLLIADGRVVGALARDGTRYSADAVAVCTGGISYPKTGSTGDGYRLAEQAGHTVVPPRPSLIPVCVREPDCALMQGLSLKNIVLRVTDGETGREIFSEMGEMLFTHFGISGPLVLSASAHMRETPLGRYRLSLDIKPALSMERLDKRLLREIAANPNRSAGAMLGTLLPRSMVPVAAARSGISRESPCHAMTREQRKRLLSTLKDFTLTPEGFRPVREAVVTAGGVSVGEIDPRTMASKLVKGLYFAGEVLDVDAYTGGFNLQIAFSTGTAAGRAMAKEKIG